MANIKIYKQLSFLRKQKGLTQEELAQIFGVTNQSVSKWESGISCPDISLLPDIADCFGVSLDVLFGKSLSIVATSMAEPVPDVI
ncbi:MAG: helix-turn-helix transcriptional regulator [Eubacteriales bacterium]|nr:helix-turn-helix transcriptional regulator [Eubacteriales bacterium]